MTETSMRFKDFENIIIDDNKFEKSLRIQLHLENVNITKLLSYLKKNGWSDYKFNQYSMKTQNDNGKYLTITIIGYIPPSVKFK